MPRPFRFTREEIINTALSLTRQKGLSAVTARALGNALGTSSRPIFSLFKNMDDVQEAVIFAAAEFYQIFFHNEIAHSPYPSYKAAGMAYIHFAVEEKELFRLLFMRDRTHEQTTRLPSEDLSSIIESLQAQLHLNLSSAYAFHIEIWLFVHGIATALVTGYITASEEEIAAMLTDVYTGLVHRFTHAEYAEHTEGN